MTVLVGDKVASVPTKTGSVAVSVGSPAIGDTVVSIPTKTGQTLAKVSTVSVGGKCLFVPDSRGKYIAVNPDNYSGTYAWFQQSATTGGGNIGYHACVALSDDSILIIGGYLWRSEVRISTNHGVTWKQQTASAAFGARGMHTAVRLPDDTVVITGGFLYLGGYAPVTKDVYTSTDNGATWTSIGSAPWSARAYHSSVILSTGAILILGGYGDFYTRYNDVWQSIDGGTSWIQQTASAEWQARSEFAAVALHDNSIVIMGGNSVQGGINTPLNDVWRSTNRGVTWTRQTAAAEWSARGNPKAVCMSDGSIMLMGGGDTNEVWRSWDQGVSWAQQTETVGWSPRNTHAVVALSGNKIALIAGDIGVDSSNTDSWEYRRV